MGGGFSQWLRSNSERSLLADAQRRVAARYGTPAPTGPRGLRDRFWRQVFAPSYRLLPWGLRRRAIAALPGVPPPGLAPGPAAGRVPGAGRVSRRVV